MQKKIIIGGLAGTVALFLLGWLVYGVVLKSYFDANSLTGVYREVPDFLPLVLGHLAMGFLLAIILGQWVNVTSMAQGIRVAFIAGFLFTFGVDFIMLGASNISNLQATFVDVIAGSVMYAIAGAIVTMAMGSSAKPVAA